MPNYTVISNLHFDGKPYAPGKTVKIDDEDQAKALLDCGCIEPGKSEKSEKKEPEKKAPEKKEPDPAGDPSKTESKPIAT